MKTSIFVSKMTNLIKQFYFFINFFIKPVGCFWRICKEASDFVWAKHRPWSHDDMFAEYMCLVNDMCIDKWNELYG